MDPGGDRCSPPQPGDGRTEHQKPQRDRLGPRGVGRSLRLVAVPATRRDRRPRRGHQPRHCLARTAMIGTARHFSARRGDRQQAIVHARLAVALAFSTRWGPAHSPTALERVRSETFCLVQFPLLRSIAPLAAECWATRGFPFQSSPQRVRCRPFTAPAASPRPPPPSQPASVPRLGGSPAVAGSFAGGGSGAGVDLLGPAWRPSASSVVTIGQLDGDV